MNKVKLFGRLEHIAFYLVLLFSFVLLYAKDFMYAYVIIILWFVSVGSHIIESKYEGKKMKKIMLG